MAVISALNPFGVLAGFSGSAPIACGGGSISDLFSERDRASAMAAFSLGPLIGEFTVSNTPGLTVDDTVVRACRRSHCWRFYRSDGRREVGLYRHRRYEQKLLSALLHNS